MSEANLPDAAAPRVMSSRNSRGEFAVPVTGSNILVALTLLGLFAGGAVWVGSVTLGGASSKEASAAANLATNDRVTLINMQLGDRIVRLEHDTVGRFEGDEKKTDETARQVWLRADDASRAIAALDIRLTRVETQKCFANPNMAGCK